MPVTSCAGGCCVWGMYPQPTVEVEGKPGHFCCPQCGHEERDNEPDFKCSCDVCKRRAASSA